MTVGGAAAPIALDVSAGIMDRAGTGNYTVRLAAALAELLGDRLRTVTCPSARARQSPRTVRDRVMSLRHDLWWVQLGAERAALAVGAGVLHMPAGVGPVRRRLPVVLTIHDIAVLRFPERFNTWFRHYARVVLPRAARRADAVITVSEASRADIAERLGVPEGRISVIPHGVDADLTAARQQREELVARIRERYRLPEAFILSVGSIEPRKNLPRLLHALQLLRSRPETADAQLVHAGPYGWLAGDVAATVERLGPGDGVRFLGFVERELLVGLYYAATAVAYPSLFEGFGFPVLEAMTAGCPVLTSNASSLPEVAGDAALLVDPESTEAIAAGLARLWTEPELRRRLAEAGRSRAAQFSWERAAAATAQVYARVMGD